MYLDFRRNSWWIQQVVVSAVPATFLALLLLLLDGGLLKMCEEKYSSVAGDLHNVNVRCKRCSRGLFE